ncbi:MAG: hypothetical protein IPL46_06000 [Saprospiraceae bacterium]|nr:hypothetical protein [Saprospiraceae bacterium]
MELNKNLKFSGAVTLVIILILLISFQPDVLAQCPMCKMTAESNMAAGGSGGKGLNIGILFMLSLPYLFAGTIGYFWWRNSRKVRQ